ncbi:Sucraseferredoxin-like protein [Scheffersomyces coipomensis]|uniref:Sucraseferredoxin-like protein n=1 Tax=Scheffersomyces coipomensis TaxID=1788519 RepID=UPI00315DCBD5
MTGLILRRFQSTGSKIIASCPKPEYDTGCTFCEVPALPFSKQIDMTTNLASTKTAPWKHVLILSHGIRDFNDMPSKIEFIPDSLSSSINHLKNGRVSAHHPILVSNILLKEHDSILKSFGIEESKKDEQLVYIYPDNKVVKFDISKTVQFIKHYLTPADHQLEAVYNPFKVAEKVKIQKDIEDEDVKDTSHNFIEYPISKNLVLICGHTKRDIRCGVLAPLLENEFSKVLQKEGLHQDTELGLISHIGGHVYAGNVIYFPKDVDNNHGIWYGRVFPDRVQGIVKQTIMKGNIIKELYRGQLAD